MTAVFQPATIRTGGVLTAGQLVASTAAAQVATIAAGARVTAGVMSASPATFQPMGVSGSITFSAGVMAATSAAQPIAQYATLVAAPFLATVLAAPATMTASQAATVQAQLLIATAALQVAVYSLQAPPPITVSVGMRLPDWGQEYIRLEMEEDEERSHGMPRRSERPPMPVAAGDWGQIILGERMLSDEEDL